MEATVFGSGGMASALHLPLVPRTVRSLQAPFPMPAEDPELPGYASISAETVSGFAEIREIRRNERSQSTTVQATNSGSDSYPWGVVSYTEEITHSLSDPEPAGAAVESTYTTTVEAGGRVLRFTGVLHFSSDEGHYYYDYTRKLEEKDSLIRERHWRKTIPRE
jgi:hypothetical protein